MTYLLLGLLGLCLGSFANALVWRLHQQSMKPKAKPAKTQNLSITTGRSMCPNCRHTLAPAELIPVLSWLFLGGKCRHCKKPISWHYPLVELLTGALFILSLTVWPYGFSTIGLLQFGLWLIILVLSLALGLYDLKWLLMPNAIVYPLVGLAAGSALLQGLSEPHLGRFLVRLAISLILGSGIFYTLFQISAGKWIGGGDVRFGLVYGFLMADPLKSILVLFLASIFGSLFALPLLINRKIKIKAVVPFGPFLIAAVIVVYLWGDSAIAWYARRVLIG